jgi:hypothetical protein
MLDFIVMVALAFVANFVFKIGMNAMNIKAGTSRLEYNVPTYNDPNLVPSILANLNPETSSSPEANQIRRETLHPSVPPKAPF